MQNYCVTKRAFKRRLRRKTPNERKVKRDAILSKKEVTPWSPHPPPLPTTSLLPLPLVEL